MNKAVLALMLGVGSSVSAMEKREPLKGEELQKVITAKTIHFIQQKKWDTAIFLIKAPNAEVRPAIVKAAIDSGDENIIEKVRYWKQFKERSYHCALCLSKLYKHGISDDHYPVWLAHCCCNYMHKDELISAMNITPLCPTCRAPASTVVKSFETAQLQALATKHYASLQTAVTDELKRRGVSISE